MTGSAVRLQADASADLDAPDDFARTCVLLLLHEHPMGCEELCERLHGVGLIGCDRAWMDDVMRDLHALEIVRTGGGPAAEAAWQLTPQGVQRLGDAADDLRSTRVLLGRFLARSSERIVDSRQQL